MTKLIRTITIFLAIFIFCMPIFVQATSVNMNLTSNTNTTANNTITNNTISDENDDDLQNDTISDSLTPTRNKPIYRFSNNKWFKSITRS